MAQLARDVMTSDPACCTAGATLDQIARLMTQHDCGQIPILDHKRQPIGVITDRDIVCRAIAVGRDPMSCTAEEFMSKPAVTVSVDTPLDEVVSTMERHQFRRVPVVDESGCCAGIIAQADVAREAVDEGDVAELVREVSRENAPASR